MVERLWQFASRPSHDLAVVGLYYEDCVLVPRLTLCFLEKIAHAPVGILHNLLFLVLALCLEP